MLLSETVSDLQKFITSFRIKEESIGFVPTMGALHEGHLSLIERSKRENSRTICSIFINPVQFNNKNDFSVYPKDIEGDVALLKSAACDVLFYPDYKEIYPAKIPESADLGGLDKILEGSFRPGHFEGVGIVVKRFFELIRPNRAYFGLKDYQQFLVVKKMNASLSLGIDIIGCETKRDADGLAMSSRNRLLSKEGRLAALLFFQSLMKAKNLFASYSMEEISNMIRKDFDNSALCTLEYFEMVDAQSLEKIKNKESHREIIACIAGYVDGVRLIDNLILIP